MCVYRVPQSKYKNKKIESEGQKFDSRKEYNRYLELMIYQESGVIQDLKRQVPFVICNKVTDENGKTIQRESKYIADFTYLKDGKLVVEDAKGYRTDLYKLKKKLMLERYGIMIKEV